MWEMLQAKYKWRTTLDDFMKAEMNPIPRGHVIPIMKLLEDASGKEGKAQVLVRPDHSTYASLDSADCLQPVLC